MHFSLCDGCQQLVLQGCIVTKAQATDKIGHIPEGLENSKITGLKLLLLSYVSINQVKEEKN